MLQISVIRENTEKVIAGLRKKHFANAENIITQVLEIDTQRRQAQKEQDDTLAESNRLSKQIGVLMKEGKTAEAEQTKIQAKNLSEEAKKLVDKVNELEEQLRQILVTIPNIPSEQVPEGKTAEENVVVHQHGEIPNLPENALPHWELIVKYNIIDFELGNKVTGAGFPFYKGKGAKLQRALINFFLDEAEKAGYYEVQPPILVNKDSGFGTGQLPDKDGQMYYVGADELYLIPTAEVPITNIYRDVILELKDLPIRNVGYTPCFRREAGSWGADVRGLNRLHQFDKVEIVQIQHPEKSYEALEEMRLYVQGLLEKLELPYRVVKLCGGDMSFTSALTYDMEVYSAAQKKWLEVSSVSNFESYQANRLKLRFRDENKKVQLLHTLNGSALALPRIVAAMLENNQTTEGIRIPKVLRPYTGFEKIG
ncbi:serine--tRNA ligase [Raineya orbicola]|uniref:Serine--tRNA ligase n=1 Tax=Raineya orbicola TaxID=2016530 RepID=A0A2N3IK79_9BACT|nr:serine--tRNA ligase [Raineya orbicola]PKQ70740.1 serS: serine--tRNA ligase [Raineya orbicola]